MKKPRGKNPPKTQSPAATPAVPAIQIRGARVHNLKNIDVDLPRDRLVVLTGVSGSGKSSLAFDTIYAEGQRRFLECLSSSARQFLDQIERPDVDSIEGLPPTVAIEQRAGAANPRSTLGTITEIHDYLRLLYARAGTPHCPDCGVAIRRQTPEQMVEQFLRLNDGRKVQILAPLVRGRKGQHADVFRAIHRAGLIRARVDGEIIEVTDTPPKLAKTKSHTIEAIVDRVAIRPGIRSRLSESIDLALKLSRGGIVALLDADGGWEEESLNAQLNCPGCGLSLPDIDPRTFSFNSPHGACPDCDGLGLQQPVEPDGSVQVNSPDQSLPTVSAVDRVEVPCPTCGGARLNRIALAVRLGGRSIALVSSQPVGQLIGFFRSLAVEPGLEKVVPPLVAEVIARLECLVQVGVDYLSLDRGSDTLSGGELQRARLAAQLGSGLVGVCTILDEPTAGLHPSDTARLISCLHRLLEQGNSVIVVEHDLAVIQAADWVVDLGPGAGPLGGRMVAEGRPEELASFKDSVTGQYLARRPQITAEPGDRVAQTPGWIAIRGASHHNLKMINARIPLSALTCVTGVSGSGKSTLVHDVLAAAVRRHLQASGVRGEELPGVSGLSAIDQLTLVDQSPIGRSPRSIAATPSGLFGEIRRVFGMTREAKTRGFKASRFSFNARGGRCEACRGLGVRTIPMHFLPDLHVTCEECDGKRFNRQTLAVRFKGKSIADILGMRVDECLELFDAIPRVRQPLFAAP